MVLYAIVGVPADILTVDKTHGGKRTSAAAGAHGTREPQIADEGDIGIRFSRRVVNGCKKAFQPRGIRRNKVPDV